MQRLEADLTKVPELNPQSFVISNLDRLEDFWQREESRFSASSSFEGFGHQIHYQANHPDLLRAAEISDGRYTKKGSVVEDRALHLRVILDDSIPNIKVPDDFPKRLRYRDVGGYLTINSEPWVNSFCDLERWTAAVIVSRSLVERSELMSRFIIDCFVTNMLLQTGWGQLHASCLRRGRTTFLLSAPPNTGKSMTAYRLIDRGWKILTDGMAYIKPLDKGFEIYGYTVGELRLRMDMTEELKKKSIQSTSALVREDRKHVLNLRKSIPGAVIENPILPERLVVGLLERNGRRTTRIEAISVQETLEGLFPEALFLDNVDLLVRNVGPILGILEMASCYRIDLGTDQEDLVASIEQLG